MSKESRRWVADQILEQLGGREFLMVTGSKSLVYDENSLRMRLARNQSGANVLKITLRWDDLYDMVFTYHRAPGYHSPALFEKIARRKKHGADEY